MKYTLVHYFAVKTSQSVWASKREGLGCLQAHEVGTRLAT